MGPALLGYRFFRIVEKHRRNSIDANERGCSNGLTAKRVWSATQTIACILGIDCCSDTSKFVIKNCGCRTAFVSSSSLSHSSVYFARSRRIASCIRSRSLDRSLKSYQSELIQPRKQKKKKKNTACKKANCTTFYSRRA